MRLATPHESFIFQLFIILLFRLLRYSLVITRLPLRWFANNIQIKHALVRVPRSRLMVYFVVFIPTKCTSRPSPEGVAFMGLNM